MSDPLGSPPDWIPIHQELSPLCHVTKFVSKDELRNILNRIPELDLKLMGWNVAEMREALAEVDKASVDPASGNR